MKINQRIEWETYRWAKEGRLAKRWELCLELLWKEELELEDLIRYKR